MRRSKPESFSLDRETCVTESRSGLPLQMNEIFGQTLIGSNAHPVHVRNEIAIRKEQLRRENLSADLDTLIQI